MQSLYCFVPYSILVLVLNSGSVLCSSFTLPLNGSVSQRNKNTQMLSK